MFMILDKIFDYQKIGRIFGSVDENVIQWFIYVINIITRESFCEVNVFYKRSNN
jgi:hypothetical protein